jgi:hypothetical protein
MGNQFSSGKHAIAACDICGQRFKLRELKETVVKGKKTSIMACSSCWSPDHPQLFLGSFPVYDPQAVRNPRPDRGYEISGVTVTGTLGSGSRIVAWGWNPVGGGDSAIDGATPNPLAMRVEVGTVTIAIT